MSAQWPAGSTGTLRPLLQGPTVRPAQRYVLFALLFPKESAVKMPLEPELHTERLPRISESPVGISSRKDAICITFALKFFKQNIYMLFTYLRDWYGRFPCILETCCF